MSVARGSALSVRKDGRPKPFDRILIANRGEIALRIIRTCRDLGVEVVAVHSDADVDAAHVAAADMSVRLGPAAPGESYLRGDAIVEAALASGAQAIHPGYGFLSERAAFARAVVDAGLAFIGPRPDAIDALGDKLAARRTAAGADVPVVPGTFDPLATDHPDAVAGIIAEAERIGFPLFVKAAAGGGGRGMRRVTDSQELPAALAAGAAEAMASFGDGAVYLEREIRPARHIEVQLLGDAAGAVVALGERDCSIQRRHQKLVEETPAPGLTPAERAEVQALAVRAASAAGLHSAATAEFLFDTDRRFWFLEVNARLQVEHGVTELVSDLDLVAEQLWIATGRPLSVAVHAAAAAALDPRRHAIEVRLSAEDPARDFAPVPGRVGDWVMPSGPGIRVDTAVRPGDRIPPDYDPMIAKVMAVGADRLESLGRLRASAGRDRGDRHPDDAPVRSGVARRPAVRRPVRRRALDRLGPGALGRTGRPGAGARCRRDRGRARVEHRGSRHRDVFAQRRSAVHGMGPSGAGGDGRPVAPVRKRAVRVSATPASASLDDEPTTVEPGQETPSGGHRIPSPATSPVDRDGRRTVEVVVDGWRFEFHVEDAARAALRERASRGSEAAAGAGGPLEIRAIIPGRVASVAVTPGDRVESGQALLAVEAMKMQNELRTPRAGTVSRVAVAPGATVEVGDVLVVVS